MNWYTRHINIITWTVLINLSACLVVVMFMINSLKHPPCAAFNHPLIWYVSVYYLLVENMLHASTHAYSCDRCDSDPFSLSVMAHWTVKVSVLSIDFFVIFTFHYFKRTLYAKTQYLTLTVTGTNKQGLFARCWCMIWSCACPIKKLWRIIWICVSPTSSSKVEEYSICKYFFKLSPEVKFIDVFS